MKRITIDKQSIEVNDGIPVIAAAKQAGIEIPSMCWREGKKHITSCMICLVKDAKTGRLFPSCSVNVSDGMEVITMDAEIQEARKTALDLLLSEHVGDCIAPCQVTCPAHMNIPQMNRFLAQGDFDNALKVVKRDIALPAVFGRICQAPCEGACRRKTVDETVSICLLKRYAGDNDLLKNQSYLPPKEKENGKKIGIIGAGPAGLSAAFYLQLRGYSVQVIDSNPTPGGSLKTEVESGKLPEEILKKEVGIIESLGVKFIMNTRVDKAVFSDMLHKYDALLIATGMGKSGVSEWGIEMSDKGIKAYQDSLQTSIKHVFVAGSAYRPAKMAIKALGHGKEAAFCIDQYLQNKEIIGEYTMFNSRFGKLFQDEFSEYLKESVPGLKIVPENISEGLSANQVIEEAKRCLHCDCREIDSCRLRIYSDQYSANQERYRSEDRKKVKKYFQHDIVVFEPAKCIKCGICIDITAEHNEELGLTFVGRGFDIEVGIPFSTSLVESIRKTAVEVANGCPTGALSVKKD